MCDLFFLCWIRDLRLKSTNNDGHVEADTKLQQRSKTKSLNLCNINPRRLRRTPFDVHDRSIQDIMRAVPTLIHAHQMDEGPWREAKVDS